MTKNKTCQSCGMPMKQDPQGGGTNADASKNLQYCSYCYQNGAFTFLGTLDEFRKKTVDSMVETGRSRWLSNLLMSKNRLKKLERWKNN